MRKIAILSLVLAALPCATHAMEIRSFGSGANFDVYGDFGGGQSLPVGVVGFTYDVSPFTDYNHDTQSPFEWYHVFVRAPLVDVEIYACNDWESHCGRSNANYNDVLSVYGINGVGQSWVYGGAEGNVQITFNAIVQLNDGFSFTAPAVPEPATWALLLLGFAGLMVRGFRLAFSQFA